MPQQPRIRHEDSQARIDRLLGIMRQLRHPEGGCPWDLAQDFRSIAPYTIEEAYEVAEAINQQDMPALCDELGDLLFQVVFHAQMAAESGSFGFDDVVEAINAKMIRRHPHIFAGESAPIKTAEDQSRAWEEMKAAERASKFAEGPVSALDDAPAALPALMRAQKLQKRAARVGFDWPSAAPVFEKIEEELGELRAEMAAEPASHDRLMDEFGDLLFACVNLGRHLGLDAEEALRRGNAKFSRRFRAVEDQARQSERSIKSMTIDELEGLWQQVKQAEKRT